MVIVISNYFKKLSQQAHYDWKGLLALF